MKTLPQAFISDFYMLGSALRSLRSLSEVLLEGRQTLKPNYTSEFKSSPSNSGEPEEHARTGTARLKRRPEKKKKKKKVCKLCREAGHRMQILTYFSLLAGRGHEAAAIAAPQAQEMSRSPAKISAAMPLPDAGCSEQAARKARAILLLPRQQDHNQLVQQQMKSGQTVVSKKPGFSSHGRSSRPGWTRL